MKTVSLQELIKLIDCELNGAELLELETAIKKASSVNAVSVLLAKRTEKASTDRHCPHCNSDDIVKNGYDKNKRQRFRCRNVDCRKSFNILTKTPMARARKSEHWMSYIQFLAGHAPLAKITKKIKIAHQTAFRWRHRFLSAMAGNQNATLSGIIEADETFFRDSQKGKRSIAGRKARVRGGVSKRGLSNDQVPVVTALDNTGTIVQSVLRNRSQIEAALAGTIETGSLLCSDGLPAYHNVAVAAGAEHRVIAPRKGFCDKPINKGAIGLGRVNAYHGQAKALINIRCRGVSSKYLANYMGWVRAIAQSVNGEAIMENALSF